MNRKQISAERAAIDAERQALARMWGDWFASTVWTMGLLTAGIASFGAYLWWVKP
jgi:hypothetical protein